MEIYIKLDQEEKFQKIRINRIGRIRKTIAETLKIEERYIERQFKIIRHNRRINIMKSFMEERIRE